MQPATVDYDATQNRTTYQARSISIPIEKREASYGSQFRQLRMHLLANCPGRSCQPEQARITLTTSGGSELYIGDRTFVITADEEQFTWEDVDYERRNRPERIVGTILRVWIDIDRLQKMASAETIKGTVGSVDLKISAQNQERIRAFLDAMGYGADAV